MSAQVFDKAGWKCKHPLSARHTRDVGAITDRLPQRHPRHVSLPRNVESGCRWGGGGVVQDSHTYTDWLAERQQKCRRTTVAAAHDCVWSALDGSRHSTERRSPPSTVVGAGYLGLACDPAIDVLRRAYAPCLTPSAPRGPHIVHPADTRHLIAASTFVHPTGHPSASSPPIRVLE